MTVAPVLAWRESRHRSGPSTGSHTSARPRQIDFTALFARFDTFLMGRRTYEATAGQGGGGSVAAGTATYVFSTTLDRPHTRL